MPAKVETVDYFACLADVQNGLYQLPLFQRDFKWNRKKVCAFFDSLRCGYPIGTFLTVKASAFKSYSPISFSSPPPKTTPDFLLLDGQQRITAGLLLFYGDSDQQKSQYFVDLMRLQELLTDWIKGRGIKEISDISDEDLDEFGAQLDPDERYVYGRRSANDPYSLFIKDHKVFTPLLAPHKLRTWESEYDKYIERYPENKALLSIFKYLFPPGGLNTQVPNIIVQETDTRALSRIFSTLNTGGLALTSFEITVSEMFRENIDLKQEIEDLSSDLICYPHMDPTNEIVIQTTLMLANKEHQKSTMAKVLTGDIWNTYKEQAFQALDNVGMFLTDELGFALDTDKSYVPYDPIFVPLAYVWVTKKFDELKPQDLNLAKKILRKYIVASALHKRFAKSTVTIQKQDAAGLVAAITNFDERKLDATLWQPYPEIMNATTGRATGKIMLCLLNAQRVIDPLSEKPISLSDSKTEIHHIWPKKFLKTLPSGKRGAFVENSFANAMLTTAETNKQFGGDDPRTHVEHTMKLLNEKKARKMYHKQWINDAALEILLKPKKTIANFEEFKSRRVDAIAEFIKDDFGLEYSRQEEGTAEDDDDDDAGQ